MRERPPENRGSHQVLESLEKEFQSCSHSCSKSLPAPVNWEGDLYGSPRPWIACFILFFSLFTPPVFCFSKDLRLCSLKSLFPVLSHGKGKSSLEKTEGSSEKVCFSQMKFVGTWWAAFIILTGWKAAAAAAAEAVVRTSRSIRHWISYLDEQTLKMLLERQSDETALQLWAALLCLSLGSFHERQRSCQCG